MINFLKIKKEKPSFRRKRVSFFTSGSDIYPATACCWNLSLKFVLPHAQAFAVERDVPVVWLRAFEVGAIFQSAAGVATGEPWAGSLGGHHGISAYNARYKVSYPDVRV